MVKDVRNLAQVLRSELVFLDAGGYSAWAGARWRLPLVFEESPTCPNFTDSTHSVPCRNCVLMKLVPLRHQHQDVPCRHIPLNDSGETLDTLYRGGTAHDLNRVFRRWLIGAIHKLDQKEGRLKWLRDRASFCAAGLT